jgi:hypothetical protein
LDYADANLCITVAGKDWAVCFEVFDVDAGADVGAAAATVAAVVEKRRLAHQQLARGFAALLVKSI